MKFRPLLLSLTFISCGAAHANAIDPPERVGRVSYLIGDVSLQAAGEPARESAMLNWPATSGDRLITGRDARVELSLGVATLRVDEDTDLVILGLDRTLAQTLLKAGTVSIHLRDLRPGESFEVQMPRSKVQLLQPGDYRISASADGASSVVVRAGEVKISAGVASFQQLAGEEAQIASDRTVAIVRAPEADQFDRWALKRARDFSGARAAQHVARGLVGFEDLDAYGAWHWEPDFGMVWEPKRVATSWAPYRFGQWIWKPPWGWTWVDDAPWGFAPSHYGRWAYVHQRWCWLPGPRQIPPVYAPALVRWTERTGERSAIGWSPLGPRETYVPTYPVSERHARGLNIFSNVANLSSAPVQTPQAERYAPTVTWMPRSAFADHPRTWRSENGW